MSVNIVCFGLQLILGRIGEYFRPLDRKLVSALDILMLDRSTTDLELVRFMGSSAGMGYTQSLG